MEIDFDFKSIDLTGLDLKIVFWEEILSSGYTIQEEIKNQLWTFLYYAALDNLPNPDPSAEEEDALQELLNQYIQTDKIQSWISENTEKIATFLEENPPSEK
ncbi:MAG: hypothetical protein ACTSVZ_13055 [Promethearchaeota archaeon]